MSELDDLVMGIVDKRMKPVQDSFDKTLQGFKDSNQALQDSNQALQDEIAKLSNEIEQLNGKKSISAKDLLSLRAKNPDLSDQDIIDLAKKQTGVDL